MSSKKKIIFNEYHKSYPDELNIKSKKDLKEKLQKGLDDIKEGRAYTLEETFEMLNNL